MEMANAMTREEILAMPAGREMDALIAEKVFSWHSIRFSDEYPDRCFGIPAGWHRPDKQAIIQRYSTDISAALEVVKEMQRRNYWFYCSVLSSFCRARFIPADYEPLNAEAIAEVNQIPLAICRAALLAVME